MARSQNIICDGCGKLIVGIAKNGKQVNHDHLSFKGLVLSNRFDIDGERSFTYITEKTNYGLSELFVCDLDCLKDLIAKKEDQIKKQKALLAMRYVKREIYDEK